MLKAKKIIFFLFVLCAYMLPGITLAQADESRNYIEEITSEPVEYDDEGRINAAPETFVIDWSEVTESQSSVDSQSFSVAPPAVQVADEENIGRKENKKVKDKKGKSSPVRLTFRISTAAFATGCLVGGIYYDNKYSDMYDKYAALQEPTAATEYGGDMDGYKDKRDLMYILAGIGLAGFTVTLLF